MINPCQLNPLMCQNNGECTLNISSGTTYCQCDQCHYGIHCENDVWKEGKYDTNYVDLITSIIVFGFSLLNNGLIFELLICSRRIRSTNCGIYLFAYSILSLLSNILLVIGRALAYYPNRLTNDANQYEAFLCFITGLGSDALFYLCIWLSSCIAFERSLIICFNSKMNATRWRSFVTIIVMLAITVGSITPLLVYKCDWDNVPNLQTLRGVFQGFYIVVGIVIYIVATIIVLISFAFHIYDFGMENGSCIKTFLKLLKTHLLIFVPPIAYGICQIPYTIVVSTKNPNHSYYQCGISLGEFIVKVLMGALQNIPYGLTWLLFVYPSRVYMTEYYLNTWSGKRLAKIIIFFRSYNDREESHDLSTMNPTNNEHDNRDSTV